MLEFSFKSNCSLPAKTPTEYPEILKYSGSLRIVIDNKVYFEDGDFCIYEFLYYVNKWCKSANRAMEYICIDTEENPLISFIPCTDNKWIISSPWESFTNNVLFTTDELNNAIIDLKEQLKMQKNIELI